MCEKRKRVGIMGGTFDPIHIGHLILGETAYEQFDLDQVFFMPAGNPPHKRNRLHRATDEQRSEMVRRAIASNPHFSLSLEEMNEDGFTYTYRTLERLKAEHPDTDYFFILGADSLFDFDKWREPGTNMQERVLWWRRPGIILSVRNGWMRRFVSWRKNTAEPSAN